MSRIEIILTEPAQTKAYYETLKRNAGLLRAEFRGPVFESAKWKASPVGLEVHVGDDVYIYPAHTIARVKASKEVAE